jgi:glycerophosphoryl diester phosphodiesterase
MCHSDDGSLASVALTTNDVFHGSHLHPATAVWATMNPLLDLSAHPIIGHRGAAGACPENTRASFELALAHGADALEFDVHLSADGTPVLMHDPLLDRTTSETGPLLARTAVELAACDAGYHWSADAGKSFPWRGRGIGVPSLAEVLESFPKTPLLIELKTVTAAEPVRHVLEQHAAKERVVLASFLDAALQPFRQAGFATAASRRGNLSLWLRSKVGLGAAAGPDRLYAVPDHYLIWTVPTSRFVRAARKAGRPVHVWTENEPSHAVELWRRGVSGIITDFPERMVRTRVASGQ